VGLFQNSHGHRRGHSATRGKLTLLYGERAAAEKFVQATYEQGHFDDELARKTGHLSENVGDHTFHRNGYGYSLGAASAAGVRSRFKLAESLDIPRGCPDSDVRVPEEKDGNSILQGPQCCGS